MAELTPPTPMPDARLAAIVRAGLVMPHHGAMEWKPATYGERHLLDQARMLDGVRTELVREVYRLRQRERELRAATAVLRVPQLSGRHRAVLHAAAAGEAVSETAARLHLTTGTVNSYRYHAVRTIGARNITHAVALAVAAGVVTAAPAGGVGR